MHRNQYTKVNDKKVLHKVKKQWVVISSAILMAMSSGMVVNHVTHKPTSMIDTIETRALGLHNHLLQSGLHVHADTTQMHASGQSANAQRTSNNVQSVSSSVNDNAQSAVTINTSKGSVAVSNTSYNDQVAEQQQINDRNTITGSNTYQSNNSTNTQSVLNSGQSSNPSVNQQPVNNNVQSAVTINTPRGPVAVSNTPYNAQIAKRQAISAQDVPTSASSSNNPINSSSKSQQPISHNEEKQNSGFNAVKGSSNHHINLQSTPPKEQLSETKSQPQQKVMYNGQNIAPGAVFDAGNINGNGNDVKGTIQKNPNIRFQNEYDADGKIVNQTYPFVPYTLNGNDDLFSKKPIAKNWKIKNISDNRGNDLPNAKELKNFYYEDPEKYQFSDTSDNYMYNFSPNYITNGKQYIQVPSNNVLSDVNSIPYPYRLKVYYEPKQDTIKFNGLKNGTKVNGQVIGNVGNDFGDSNSGLNVSNPVNFSAPAGYHFITTGPNINAASRNFKLNNYVSDIGYSREAYNPSHLINVINYYYGKSDKYNGSYTHSDNNYYFKYFNVGTIDGSFITLNVKPDTANVIYTYNGNRVDTTNSDNYTYNSDTKYNTDKNGNPIADAITSAHHPGLPSDSGYHLINPSTSIPFNNGTTEIPVEPNTFTFNYVDNNGKPVAGRNQPSNGDYQYNQPTGPKIPNIVNSDIDKDVPSGYTLVSNQTNNLKYDNHHHHFIVIPASSLRKTITRTIHYENANDQPSHDIYSSVAQPITYDRTATLSNNSVSYSPFSYASGTGTWSAVATPNLSRLGYKSAEAPYAQSVPSSATPNGNQASNVSLIVKYPDSDVIITPANPGNPNNMIPNGSSKWPGGTDKDNLTRTITRTIEYLNQNGTKSLSSNVIQNVTYNRSMTVDKVTGQMSQSPWSAQNNVTSWSQVNSPEMKNQGYGNPYVYSDTNHQISQNSVANNISSSNVGVSDHNQTIDIRYPDVITTVTPNTAKAPGTRIDPNGNVTWPKGTDSDSLVHKITRTINYVNSYGQTLAPTVRQTVTYTKTVNVDHVTGQIVSSTPWTATNGLDAWPSQTSPNMSDQGYGTPYTYEKNSVLIPQNQRMTNVTTTNVPSNYTAANDETIDVLYSDTTTTVTPNSAKTPGTKINPDNNVVWPNGTDKDSLTKTITRTIHYVNERGQKVAPSDVQTVTFNRNVTVDNATGSIVGYTNWLISNDTKKAASVLLAAPSPELNHKGYGKSDNALAAQNVGGVNNKNTKNIWAEVTSPDLSSQGYGDPDKASVAQQVVNITDPNVNVTVVYPDKISNREIPNPDTITRTIYYRDSKTGQEVANPVTQQVTYTHVVNHNKVTGQTSSDWQTNNNTWSDVPSPSLSIRGYSAPSQNNVPATTVDYDDSNQTIVVTYNPGTMVIHPNGVDSRLSQTTTQTINYVGSNGKEIPGVTPNEQMIHFNRTATVDRVTGQIISYSKWQPSNGYVTVNSPDETSRGYIYPNQNTINGSNPQDPAIGDTTITVQYRTASKPTSLNSGGNEPNSYVPETGSSIQPTSVPASGGTHPGSNVPGSNSHWLPISSSSNSNPSSNAGSSGSSARDSNSSGYPTSEPAGGNNRHDSNVPTQSLPSYSAPSSANDNNKPIPNVPGSNSSRHESTSNGNGLIPNVPTPRSAGENNNQGPSTSGSNLSGSTSGLASSGNQQNPNVSVSSSSWRPMSSSGNDNTSNSTRMVHGSATQHGYVPFNNKIHYASTAGEFIQPGASRSSMGSSNDYNRNERLSNLGFKPLRRSTPRFSRPTKSMHYDNSYPFVKLNTGRHTIPKREDRRLPQTGEHHNYSSLFGTIMALTATLIAALGKELDRHRNK